MNGAEASFKASVQDAGCPSGKPRVTHHLCIFITASTFSLSLSLSLHRWSLTSFCIFISFNFFSLPSHWLPPCLSLYFHPSFFLSYLSLFPSLFIPLSAPSPSSSLSPSLSSYKQLWYLMADVAFHVWYLMLPSFYVCWGNCGEKGLHHSTFC